MIICNSTDEGKIVLSIIGQICGESLFGGASDAAALASIISDECGETRRPMEIWLASPGGDLEAAFPMVASLSSYGAPVEIHTCGLVASAATLLLCADGAKVVAHKGSVFMMHQSSVGLYGNSNEIRKAAEMLDACDSEIVALLKGRLKDKTDDEIKAMLSAETWLNTADALGLGLVDEVSGKAAAGETVDAPPEKHDDDEPKEPDETDESAEPEKKDEPGDVVLAAISALNARVGDVLSFVDKALAGVETRVGDVENAVKKAAAETQSVSERLTSVNDSVSKLDKSLSRNIVVDGGEPYHISKPAPANAAPFVLTYSK